MYLKLKLANAIINMTLCAVRLCAWEEWKASVWLVYILATNKVSNSHPTPKYICVRRRHRQQQKFYMCICIA